jgi:putative copper export protein
LFTLEASVAAIIYLVLALLVGSLVTSVVLIERNESLAFHGRLARIALALACAFLIAHFASLLVQGAKLSGGNFPAADLIWRYILRTQSGQIWLLRGLYGLLFLLVTVRFASRRRGSLTLLLLSLPLVASRILSGHAVAVRENTVWVVAADAIHLIATACWAGVLPFLFYFLIADFRSEKSALAAVAVRRFSRVALLCVSILVATGFYQSWTHVGRLDALTSTTYGNVLAVKLIIFVCMVIFGAINFLSTKPALLRATVSGLPQNFQTTALRRIAAESLLGAAILILSGFLTGLPPAVHSDHGKVAVGGAAQGPHDHRAPAGGSSAAPAQFKPAHGVGVKILSPKPGQMYKDDRVPIQFTLTKGKGKGCHCHVHAYVDNELMGMFETEKGTLTGIAPGKHVLRLRVVEADHTTELDAADEVDFIVAPRPPKEEGP